MTHPFFSIVMPSYLGEYPNAASNRPSKLRRAVSSVLGQTFCDFELIIVADGCMDTVSIVQEFQDDRIKCFFIEKQPHFSGAVRTKGLREAVGEYICYLDSDDYFENSHLQFLRNQIEKNNRPDFISFSDNLNSGEMAFGKIGTSNICHRNENKYFWPDDYEHDWRFIKEWFLSKELFVGKSGYVVCHVPGVLDA